MSRVKIGVTPYVFRYLLTQYGPGPYQVAPNSDLALGLYQMALIAETLPKQPKQLGCFIQLDLPPSLEATLSANEVLIKTGAYFQHEFFMAMRVSVQSFQEVGITQIDGLSRFLKMNGITEEEYDFQSAYRQLSRLKTMRKNVFSEKLQEKWQFSQDGFFGGTPTRIHRHGSRGEVLSFRAYSRSREAMQWMTQYIPGRLSYESRQEFILRAGAYIDDRILSGCTVR